MEHSQLSEKIKYLKRSEINDQRWNAVVWKAANGLVFATTIYLDGISPGWGALVLGDYSYIMPLPIRKKIGIAYLYQPPGVAQGGIFSQLAITESIQQSFLRFIFQKFTIGTFNLNAGCSVVSTEKMTSRSRNNFILPLDKPYEVLFKNYTKDGRKNVLRARKNAHQLKFNTDAWLTLQVFEKQYAGRFTFYKQLSRIHKLVETLEKMIEKERAINIHAYTRAGELLASTIFLTYKNRLYYVLGAPTEFGKQYGSIHYIIDYVIEKYAGTDFVLDFEGSDIPSVAQFYKKFGAVNEPYVEISFNKLPYLLQKFLR